MHYFFETLSREPIVRALCRTLVHSLWQGLAAAVLAAIVLYCTGKSRPALRYHLFCLLLLLLTGLTAFTFIWEFKSAAGASLIVSGNSTLTATALPRQAGSSILTADIQSSLWLFLDRWSWLITGIWLMLFSLKSIRLLSWLDQAYGLRYRHTSQPEGQWSLRIQELAASLDIRRRVSLLESRLADVPMVIGFLKPVLLVPIGLMARLPAAQVEAILLHELAHIRRQDYLVNLLQCALETLFFFNPFVRWLSSVIREEREACCDDMALSVTRNKEAFVGALISFSEYGLRPAGLAMGFGSSRQPLLDRVKRIAFDRNKTLSRVEQGLVGVCILFFVTAAFAFSEPAASHTRRVSPAFVKTITIATSNWPPEQDSVQIAAAIVDDLVAYGIVREDEEVSYKLDEQALVVDGVRQPEALHRQLREKYISRPGGSIVYRNSTAAAGAAAS